jgi:hypothetical protein
MKKILTLTCLFLAGTAITGQSVNISYLRIISASHAVVSVKNGVTGSDGTDNSFSFFYEHFIRNKKYSFIASYSRFNGCTLIYFEPEGWIGTDGTPVMAYGMCGGVKIHRFDVGVFYNVLHKRRKFYLKPGISLGLQISKKTGAEFWDSGEPVNGPHYFQLEPMRAEPMNTTQIVPSLGFRTGFVFWKRLDIGMGFQGVYAFRPYQKMYLKYQYKGVVQPTAEYESTGTGLFVTLGVGYRFARLIR